MARTPLGPRLRDRVVDLVRGPSWRRAAALRRAGAGVLTGAALVLALSSGPADDGVPLVVAAHDVAAGATLATADLEIRTWPAALVPDGAVRAPEDASGRVLAGAARAGEPLTDLRLVGSELTALLAGQAGAAAVPVRLADSDVAGLLVPGSRVDVVTAGPLVEYPVVLVTAAVVVTVLPAEEGTARGRLVLVAMPRDVATRVAAATITEQVAVTLR
jgi:pilus assembly protein CpaB